MTEAHGYVPYTRGCRCDVCREAKADYMRARRKAAREEANRFREQGMRRIVIDNITHGRYGYEECGCRCGVCLQARADGERKRYDRTRNGEAA